MAEDFGLSEAEIKAELDKVESGEASSAQSITLSTSVDGMLDGAWHHVALVVDRTRQTVTLYLAAKDKIYYGEGVPEYNNPQWLKDATWGGGDTGIRNVLRNHRVETGEVPVKEIELAVKQLNMDKSSGKKPELAVDSIFQKEMAKLKKGEMPDGRKLPTLTIVIKPTDNASYKNMVDALDEMQILSIGTYVIDKLNPDDEKLLKSRNVEM